MTDEKKPPEKKPPLPYAPAGPDRIQLKAMRFAHDRLQDIGGEYGLAGVQCLGEFAPSGKSYVAFVVPSAACVEINCGANGRLVDVVNVPLANVLQWRRAA